MSAGASAPSSYARAPRQRVRTFVSGLDEELQGGIPAGNLVLIAGPPGTMKTSLALWILYHNALEAGKTGVYISLEQSMDSLMQQAESMGMDFSKVQGKVKIVDMGFLRRNVSGGTQSVQWMEIFTQYAENLKKSMNYEILVGDSLAVFETFMAADKSRREKLYFLFEAMRAWGATVFVIGEEGLQRGPKRKPWERRAPGEGVVPDEEYLANGTIRLSKEPSPGGGRGRLRMALIDKMQGTRHTISYFALLFEKGKFQVTRAI
jgi:KaiC/GvpD/RAD55 family RecA-like ATPase